MSINFESFPKLLIKLDLHLLLFKVFFVPQSIGFFILALNKHNILVFCADDIIKRLYLVLIVDDSLFVSRHPVLKLLLTKAHLCETLREIVP